MTVKKIIYALICFSFYSGDAYSQNANSPYIDIQIIPVGSIPLARFGVAESTPASSSSQTSTNQKKDDDKEPAAPQHGSEITVINLPEDERPIRQLYVKIKNSYYALSCHQNRIGAPYRIHYKDPEITFYKMTGKSESSGTFSEIFTHTAKPKQKNILITLSKPLTEKKWTKPNVKTYNLSHLKSVSMPTTVINTSSDWHLGIKGNVKTSVLKPYGITTLKTDSDKALTLQFAASPDLKRWSTQQHVTIPTRKSTNNLILAYAVTKLESKKGFKIIRGKTPKGEHRTPRKIKKS